MLYLNKGQNVKKNQDIRKTKLPKILAGSLAIWATIIVALILWLAFGRSNYENIAEVTRTASKTEISKSEEINIKVTTFPPADPIAFTSEIIELTTDSGQNYFVNYRIKREQVQDEKREMLKPLLNSDQKEVRAEAEKRWLELCNKMSQEREIENVLKMRGYKDVVSEVNPTKVTVTVLAEELKYEDYFQIMRITAAITGLPEERIEVASRA